MFLTGKEGTAAFLRGDSYLVRDCMYESGGLFMKAELSFAYPEFFGEKQSFVIYCLYKEARREARVAGELPFSVFTCPKLLPNCPGCFDIRYPGLFLSFSVPCIVRFLIVYCIVVLPEP